MSFSYDSVLATLFSFIGSTSLYSVIKEERKSLKVVCIVLFSPSSGKTLEIYSVNTWFGEKIKRFYGDKDMKVLNFGASKEFTDTVPLEELYERYHLTDELIVKDIKNALK